MIPGEHLPSRRSTRLTPWHDSLRSLYADNEANSPAKPPAKNMAVLAQFCATQAFNNAICSPLASLLACKAESTLMAVRRLMPGIITILVHGRDTKVLTAATVHSRRWAGK